KRSNDVSTSMTMALQTRGSSTELRSSTRFQQTPPDKYDPLHAYLEDQQKEGGALIILASDRSIESLAKPIAESHGLSLIDAETLVFNALHAYADTQTVDQQKMWNA